MSFNLALNFVGIFLPFVSIIHEKGKSSYPGSFVYRGVGIMTIRILCWSLVDHPTMPMQSRSCIPDLEIENSILPVG